MDGPRRRWTSEVRVDRGTRVSRRAFLRAAALAGATTAGVAAFGPAFAARRPVLDEPFHPAQAIVDPIADLAEALSYDVDTIFRFVSDKVRYEPYVGILRGPQGTLDARAGNSADQAQLLAALLDASLIPFRFAIGGIDQDAAGALSAAAIQDEATLTAATFDGLAGRLPDVEPPAPPAVSPESQAIIDAATAAQEEILGWAVKEVDDTLATITSALDAAGKELPNGFTSIPEREVDEHIWVQALIGPEWVDLDASANGAEAGVAMASASDTPDVLPEELYHVVDLAVIVENASDVGVTRDLAMNLSMRADRLAGLPMTFVNASPSGIEQFGAAVTPVAGTISYVPTLAIGDEAFGGTPIRFGRGEDLGEGLLDGAEEILGGSGLGSETSAQWLELTVTSPERDPVVVTRTIFDRFSDEARAAGELDATLLEAAETIEIEGLGDVEVLPALATTWLTVNVGVPSPHAPVLTSEPGDTGEPAVFAHGQHVMREFSELALGLPTGTRSFVDAPNVVAYTVAPTADVSGQPLVELGLDIWHRSRGVVPVAGIDSSQPPAAVAGVLDHVAERLLSGAVPGLPGRTADPTDVPTASVGSVFEAAREAGVPFLAIETPDDVASLDYPPAVAEMLRSSLASGWSAVAPQRPVELPSGDRAGWWLIDPISGRVADQLDDGRGADLEYQATLTPGQLARETAQKKLARDCLTAAALAFAWLVSSICGGLALSTGSAGAALACGAGIGAGLLGFAGPMQRCTGAALA